MITNNHKLIENVGVPMVVSDNRAYDLYSRMLSDRIIILSGEVNDAIAELIVGQLLFLESEEPNEPITMYINSPGGSVTAGFSIYDTMQLISCPVHTVCNGLAASMGAFLLSAGAEGCRSALPHAQIMIHQPLGGFYGQATDFQIRAEFMQRLKEILTRRLAEHSKRTYEEVLHACERDNWLTAEDAVEFGLIDKIQSYRNPSIGITSIRELLKTNDFKRKNKDSDTTEQESENKVISKEKSTKTSSVKSKETKPLVENQEVTKDLNNEPTNKDVSTSEIDEFVRDEEVQGSILTYFESKFDKVNSTEIAEINQGHAEEKNKRKKTKKASVKTATKTQTKKKATKKTSSTEKTESSKK